jgi:AcrR family transcriptional regulator
MEGDLPIIGADRAMTERADAARNRRRILHAAERLFAERGVEAVSMDDVARAAGVGKGTLYRRFGDRSGLARALVSEREMQLQEGLIRGAPPLGPGASPADRLHAFGDALLDLVERRGDVMLDAEHRTPGARFDHGAHRLYHAHVAMLLAQIGTPDPAYAADALLAPLSAEMVLHQRRGRGMSAARVRAGWHALARAIAGEHDDSLPRVT